MPRKGIVSSTCRGWIPTPCRDTSWSQKSLVSPRWASLPPTETNTSVYFICVSLKREWKPMHECFTAGQNRLVVQIWISRQTVALNFAWVNPACSCKGWRISRWRWTCLFPRSSPSSPHSCFCHSDPNGHLYQSALSVRNQEVDSEGVQALPLSRSLLLSLPVGEGPLEAASALILDEAHIAAVGVPHPSAGSGKGSYRSFRLFPAVTSVVAGWSLRYYFTVCLVFPPVIKCFQLVLHKDFWLRFLNSFASFFKFFFFLQE